VILSRVHREMCFAAACLVLMSSNSDAARRQRFVVTASLERTARDSYVLNVALATQDNQPVTMYEADLPWGSAQSMTLIAITTDRPGSVLERELLVDDPSPRRVTLTSGHPLRGSINLSDGFRQFNESAEKGELVLFWSYRARPLTPLGDEQHAGWLLVPKR